MKMRFMILLNLMCSISSFASCGSAGGNAVKYVVMPDSCVYGQLGKSMSEILFCPSKVTCYTILGKDSVGKEDYELEAHYVRDSLVCRLTAAQIGMLQFMLLADEENYKEDSVKVRSPYVPAVEFCFERRKMQPVHVLISLSDFSWSILYDDKKQGNWNYADKRLMERYCKMILGENIK